MMGAWPEITHTWEEKFTLTIAGDMEAQEVVFTATIPDNTYLAIAFGSDMIGVDMILFQADGEDSAAYDMWSSNFATPMYDKYNHLNTEVVNGKIGTGSKVFNTRRPYDPMDEQDYAIPFDEQINMSYALRTTGSEFIHHDLTGHFTFVFQSDGLCSIGDGKPVFETRIPLFERHGLWMWLAWGPVGFIMLWAKRYAKRSWKLAHVAHAMCGHFVLWVTLGQQLNLYLFWEWNVRWTWSAILNTVIVVWTIILCISGQITHSIMGLYDGDLPWSRKEKVTNWAKCHRYFGYIMLFLGNVVCAIGTWNYCNHFVHGKYRTFALYLGPGATLAFFMLVLIFETHYRCKERSSKMVLSNPVVSLGNKRVRVFTFA